jgi:hypothetical protein
MQLPAKSWDASSACHYLAYKAYQKSFHSAYNLKWTQFRHLFWFVFLSVVSLPGWKNYDMYGPTIFSHYDATHTHSKDWRTSCNMNAWKNKSSSSFCDSFVPSPLFCDRWHICMLLHQFCRGSQWRTTTLSLLRRHSQAAPLALPICSSQLSPDWAIQLYELRQKECIHSTVFRAVPMSIWEAQWVEIPGSRHLNKAVDTLNNGLHCMSHSPDVAFDTDHTFVYSLRQLVLNVI